MLHWIVLYPKYNLFVERFKTPLLYIAGKSRPLHRKIET